VYRQAIDDAVAGREFDRNLMTDLESLAQRGYTEGFLRRHVHDEYQNYQNGSSVSERQQFVGELTGERRGELAEVKVKNRFAVGNHLELMTPPATSTSIWPPCTTPRVKPSRWRRGTGTRCTCPCRLKWICASAC
jgi:putative protease